MNFTKLGLDRARVRKCESVGFLEPTPIQKKAIPVILEGSDLIGCAETGTGKTAAFLLPIIQKLSSQKPGKCRVLIVAPTRELAAQITENYIELSPGNLRCVNLIGGANMDKQLKALRRGVSLIVATPGRLIDHLKRGTVKLDKIETLVLDEADRMLDMGFLPAIREIVERIPRQRQTLLFSATMSDSVKTLAYTMMDEPLVIEVSRKNRTAKTVNQIAFPVAAASKTAFLLDLLETNDLERVIVFTRTKRGADRLAHILSARDLRAGLIHSSRTQSQRERVLKSFKQGKTQILVATDIASRGIDVDCVSHVINYDVPHKPDDYVHRVGRTGRAGNSGKAITLVTPVEELAVRDIERLTKQQLKRVVVPGYDGKSIASGTGVSI